MSGAINVALNWRWTFRVLGVVGLVLVPLGAVALWEPRAVQEQRRARQEGKTSYSIKVGGGGRGGRKGRPPTPSRWVVGEGGREDLLLHRGGWWVEGREEGKTSYSIKVGGGGRGGRKGRPPTPSRWVEGEGGREDLLLHQGGW